MSDCAYKFISDSESSTEQLGERLAKTIDRGCIIALFGDLGAGKTAFTRGLARGFGSRERVSSPTYTVVNEYPTDNVRICHFDMYRLSGSEALYDIGWEDYISDPRAVCVVEWSERIADSIPGDAITVRISKCENAPNKRIIEIENSKL